MVKLKLSKEVFLSFSYTAFTTLSFFGKQIKANVFIKILKRFFLNFCHVCYVFNVFKLVF